ncbi:camphor resistance protein CrcB [Fervidicella metallireducens AeB]|uniref:Fluoride-specific ion channel FluC n=1 Tax=Fervidicella metallireducens AeB TaxID=1403537 RepID=A0A017RW49_9CLOT|nr:fluoride efflux transporter CrcB [Fervidicella metallireducens]EYE88841.1 camphor resistance protein CrcB [Fervidicella metallireducens AeB]
MQKILYVGIGGFIGASLRYLISLSASKLFGTQMPCGTLIVNILGGLLIGFIMEISLSTDLISSNLRLFLTTGIMGGLTTFSTFSYETITFFNDGRFFLGTVNICLNLFLSLSAVILGKFTASNII